MAHVSDDGNHVGRRHFFCLFHQRGEELGLPVAAADVVIQLAATRVTQRLRAVEAADALGKQIFRIYALLVINIMRLGVGQFDLHAAHCVDDGDDGRKIDAEPAVDVQIKHAVHGIHQRVFILCADDGIELDVFAGFIGHDNVARKGYGVNLSGIKADLHKHHHVAAAAVVERAVVIDAHDEESLGAVRMADQHQRQQNDGGGEHNARRFMRGEKGFGF